MSWLSKGLQRFAGDFNQIVNHPLDEIRKGPRGTTGDIFGSGEEEEEDVAAPSMSAGDIEAAGEEGALQEQRRKLQGRAAMNLSPASGSTILTQ
tara:strand:- start:1555 stop:1836 length:282 start_codon:yes stop_codon:yes gene_type:complete